MFKKIFTVCCILALLVSLSTAWGEEKIHELEEVVVTATHKMKMIDMPASISIITAKELKETGAKNIAEALKKIPGVIDKSASKNALAIRGTESSMAGGPVILIDGVPQKIGDNRYDHFDFVPVSQVERIEVLRSAGIAYGPGSARGVINIITKKGEKDIFSGEVKTSYGSWNTTDIPKSETDNTLYWHTEKDQDITTLALDFSQKGERLFLDSTASYTGYDEDYRDLHEKFTKPKNVEYDDSNQNIYTFTLSGGYNFDLGMVSYTPSVGINFKDINFDQRRSYPNDPGKNTDKYDFDIDEQQYGFFWDNDFLFGKSWGLKIGGRVDKAELKFEDKVPNKVDQDETMYGWSVAPSYHFSDRANVYASAGKNFWFPTPRYYAWAAERGGDLNRPEDLKPEESLTYELGYKHMVHKAFNIALTGFFTEYKDKFAGVYDDDGNWKGNKNIGEAEIKGIEKEVKTKQQVVKN